MNDSKNDDGPTFKVFGPDNLDELVEHLKSQGVPIPDDISPVQLIQLLLEAKQREAQDTWEGFPFHVADAEEPTIFLDKIIEEELLVRFRSMFEKHGEMIPLTFVFAKHPPNMPHKEASPGHVRRLILAAGDEFDPDTRGRYSVAIRKLAWKTDAIATVFVHESYQLSGVDEATFREYTGRLQEHPDHTEVIMVNYELEGVKHRYSAQITRDEEGRPTLGPWEKDDPKYRLMGGRFGTLMVQNNGVQL